MTAFFTKLGQWLVQTVVTLFVRYVRDHWTAWTERRQRIREQETEDEATKQPYDQAVQNGSKDDIRRATEDRLNS